MRAEAAVHDNDRVAAGIGRSAWAVLFVASILAVGLTLFLTISSVVRAAPLSETEACVGGISGAIPLVAAVWWMGQRWHLVPFRSVKAHASQAHGIPTPPT
jgi:hypothetical protein